MYFFFGRLIIEKVRTTSVFLYMFLSRNFLAWSCHCNPLGHISCPLLFYNYRHVIEIYYYYLVLLFITSRFWWPYCLRCGSVLASWNCRFHSRRVHGYLPLMSVVCCQVEVSVQGWALFQTSPTDCGVSECHRETSIMRKSWPTRGFFPMGGGNYLLLFLRRRDKCVPVTTAWRVFKLRMD